MLVAQNSLGPVCPVPLTVRGIVGDLLLALRGDEVLFVREVDGPADVTVVAS